MTIRYSIQSDNTHHITHATGASRMVKNRTQLSANQSTDHQNVRICQAKCEAYSVPRVSSRFT
ncbi:hypothetical protein D3C85_1871920 [compost metagenome]